MSDLSKTINYRFWLKIPKVNKKLKTQCHVLIILFTRREIQRWTKKNHKETNFFFSTNFNHLSVLIGSDWPKNVRPTITHYLPWVGGKKDGVSCCGHIISVRNFTLQPYKRWNSNQIMVFFFNGKNKNFGTKIYPVRVKLENYGFLQNVAFTRSN